MRTKHITLLGVALVLIIAVFSRAPIPQDPRYHVFADTRTMLGIPNAVNVLSNLGFVLAGAWGLIVVLGQMRLQGGTPLPLQYLLFFGGVFLSGIGSMYYHMDPTNSSLVWDRLPMALAFMALFSSVLSESIDRRLGSVLLAPLIALGIMSVLYWAWTEQAGRGDLRPYVLIQFLPVLLIPLMLVLYRPSGTYALTIWLLTGLYVLSKVFEVLDLQVYAISGISGHTVKHLLAAAGAAAVAIYLGKSRSART